MLCAIALNELVKEHVLGADSIVVKGIKMKCGLDSSTGIKQRLHISETNIIARDRYVIAHHRAPQSSPGGARLHHVEVLMHHLVWAFHD